MRNSFDEALLEEAIAVGLKSAINFLNQNRKSNFEKHNIESIKYISQRYRKIKQYIAIGYGDNKLRCSLYAEDDNTSLFCFCQKGSSIENLMYLKSPKLNIIYSRFHHAYEIYKKNCIQSNQGEAIRRINIFSELYINEQEISPEKSYIGDKYDWLADKYHINKRTIYKDLDKVYAGLASIYFGQLILSS